MWEVVLPLKLLRGMELQGAVEEEGVGEVEAVGGALAEVEAEASSRSGEADWETWHERLCHVNFPMLQKLVKDGSLKGLEVKGGVKEIGSCSTCLETKFSKFPFNSTTGPAKTLLALVHMDVVGPTRAPSLSGSRYFLTIVDDHTRAVWVYPLKSKGEVAPAVLKEWMPRAQRECGHKVKVIRSDNGGEFIGADFEGELKRKGIQHQRTVPYNPQQNGVAERFNRTLQEGARTLLGRAGLPDPFWVSALRQVALVKNRVLATVGDKEWIPYTKWYGSAPAVNMLRAFGCMIEEDEIAHCYWAPIPEPKTREEALNGPNGEKWKASEDEEFGSLIENETWDLCDLPPGKKAITSKMIYRHKYGPEGELTRYKSRLVARGFQQTKGKDYNEVFAPVGKGTTLRVLLAIAALLGWKIRQMDIVTAFLNGIILEEVYMKQPEGLDDGSGRVCRLKKAIYGLKQAPRAWYHKLEEALLAGGFKKRGGAVSWCSKKQNEVGLSSCETEYMALHHGAKEVVWLRRLLEELGVGQEEPTVVFCDNESAVKLAKNACLHGLTKHIRPKSHWVRRLLDKEVRLEIVKTHQQAADIFTKRLAEADHWKGMKLAGMSVH
ncbi:hypothetical protein CLOM_g12753 [Closterium sp. NIES-68]|nr:hypothetical protein CLOM_g12753 [Closterium sp. NIES-68]